MGASQWPSHAYMLADFRFRARHITTSCFGSQIRVHAMKARPGASSGHRPGFRNRSIIVRPERGAGNPPPLQGGKLLLGAVTAGALPRAGILRAVGAAASRLFQKAKKILDKLFQIRINRKIFDGTRSSVICRRSHIAFGRMVRSQLPAGLHAAEELRSLAGQHAHRKTVERDL